MNIKVEPCPICGKPVDITVLRFTGEPQAICNYCKYEGPSVGGKTIERHNRLSQIVRSAERLVKARKALVDAFALMDMDFPHFSVSEKARDMDFEIEQANRALTDAVEGGAE